VSAAILQLEVPASASMMKFNHFVVAVAVAGAL
jgi:hypothetical protein